MVHSHHHHPLLQDILRPLLVTIGNHHLLLLVLFPLHKQFLKTHPPSSPLQIPPPSTTSPASVAHYTPRHPSPASPRHNLATRGTISVANRIGGPGEFRERLLASRASDQGWEGFAGGGTNCLYAAEFEQRPTGNWWDGHEKRGSGRKVLGWQRIGILLFEEDREFVAVQRRETRTGFLSCDQGCRWFRATAPRPLRCRGAGGGLPEHRGYNSFYSEAVG